MDTPGFGAPLSDLIPQPWRDWLFEITGNDAEALAPAFSPEFVDRVLPYIEPFYRYYFRCEVRHLDRVPPAPVFAVANHNGMGTVEVLLLLYAWHRTFGHDRPARGLAHRMVFRWPLAKSLMPRLGAVPAAPDVAKSLLAQGHDLLVFPGGDWEAGRPVWDRKKIDFGGRQGFVRVALETGVPVVPLAICGAHETTLILSRGQRISQFLGLDRRQRLKTFPILPQTLFALYKAVQVARGKASPLWMPLWITAAAMGFPWLPSRITMEVLDPIDLRAAVGHLPSEKDRLQAGYDLVTGKLQRVLDRLHAERRTFFG